MGKQIKPSYELKITELIIKYGLNGNVYVIKASDGHSFVEIVAEKAFFDTLKYMDTIEFSPSLKVED